MMTILALGIVVAHIVGHNATEISAITLEIEEPEPHQINWYWLTI